MALLNCQERPANEHDALDHLQPLARPGRDSSHLNDDDAPPPPGPLRKFPHLANPYHRHHQRPSPEVSNETLPGSREDRRIVGPQEPGRPPARPCDPPHSLPSDIAEDKGPAKPPFVYVRARLRQARNTRAPASVFAYRLENLRPKWKFDLRAGLQESRTERPAGHKIVIGSQD